MPLRSTTHANEPKALAVIDGADHNFTNGETMAELFRETVDGLNQHSPDSLEEFAKDSLTI